MFEIIPLFFTSRRININKVYYSSRRDLAKWNISRYGQSGVVKYVHRFFFVLTLPFLPSMLVNVYILTFMLCLGASLYVFRMYIHMCTHRCIDQRQISGGITKIT